MKINFPRALGLTILFSVCFTFAKRGMDLDLHILLEFLPSVVGWLLSFERIRE